MTCLSPSLHFHSFLRLDIYSTITRLFSLNSPLIMLPSSLKYQGFMSLGFTKLPSQSGTLPRLYEVFQLHLVAIHEGRVGSRREHNCDRSLKWGLCCCQICRNSQGPWLLIDPPKLLSKPENSEGCSSGPGWGVQLWPWWLHWEGQWLFWPALAVAEGLIGVLIFLLHPSPRWTGERKCGEDLALWVNRRPFPAMDRAVWGDYHHHCHRHLLQIHPPIF